ncbi:MAG: PSD1 domain-containing protein [Pirellulaceae bacterium]|nr:PSD1 domain-containing protein [Pirellulaceae bacterium]
MPFEPAVVRHVAGAEPREADQRPVDFAGDVLPLLEARCFRCHEGLDPPSGVRLDVRSSYLDPAQPLVALGRAADSRLVQLVSGADADSRMPPEGPLLAESEVRLLRNWIDQGLAWDASRLPDALDATRHWAFQPLRRPARPETARLPLDTRSWTENPLDEFVAERMAAQGLRPADEAPRRVLAQRLALDLLGLPLEPDQLARFELDNRPGAYERLVDRLFASPHYGERWGRHWLDLARWAESEGYESNHERPYAWRYRDYVVASFNRAQPFDQFLTEQLAGDELQPYRDEHLIATGFLAAARLSSNEEDKWLQRNAVLVDIVNATGSVFLGLTVGCAQCHDHKFDPLTAADYYRLQAYFLPGQPVNLALQGEMARAQTAAPPADYEPAVALRQAIFAAARQRRDAEVRAGLSAAERQALDTPRRQRTVEQELLARQADLLFQATPAGIEKYIPAADRKLYDELARKIAELERQSPPAAQAFAFYSPVTSPHRLRVLPMQGFYPLPFDPRELADLQPYVQIRGNVHQLGPVVRAGVPDVFDDLMPGHSAGSTPQAATGEAAASHGSRLELARWLCEPRHPLTARVWVNRLWQYHFGRGIVATPGDFGLRGERPTHPELLDWLAAELLSSGWDTRHVQRRIVTSATYRQSSRAADPEFVERDPDNLWLSRWRPRRLEAEAVRDRMLAVSGMLDRRVGGASVPPDQFAASGRRSLYLFQKRGLAPPIQALLDGPNEISESCQQRQVSTTSLQSLYLLNSEQSWMLAERLAETVERQVDQNRRSEGTSGRQRGDESSASRGPFVELVFLQALGRLPTEQELRAADRFFAEFPAADDHRGARVHFCQAVLNLNEFAYLE